MEFLQPKGAVYQHALIVHVTSGLWAYTCIVCQCTIGHGDDAVLFDKGPHADHVLAAHGHCIKALSNHLMSDRDMARMFTEYRQELLERYELT